MRAEELVHGMEWHGQKKENNRNNSNNKKIQLERDKKPKFVCDSASTSHNERRDGETRHTYIYRYRYNTYDAQKFKTKH